MSRPRIASAPSIVFADRALLRVFKRIAKYGPCVDDELIDGFLREDAEMTPERVRALYGALKELGLVEINDTLNRGARIIKPTRRGIALARSIM